MSIHRDERLAPIPRPAPFEGNRTFERVQSIKKFVTGLGKSAIQGFHEFTDVITAPSQHDLDYPSASFMEYIAKAEEVVAETPEVQSLGWQRKP
jgi:hypothetical protein